MPPASSPTKAGPKATAKGNGAREAAIQPISRALHLLEVLNQRRLSTIDELHRDTGHPKSSLVRLLNALISDGYVAQVSRTAGYRVTERVLSLSVTQVSRTAGYRVTERVLSLSAGFRQRDQLVDASVGPMRKFTTQHQWPLYLATFENFMMAVRFSTADLSPIAPDLSGYNLPFNMLTSAVGRAYLAFCPDKERELILATLVQSTDDLDQMAKDRPAVDALLESVRAKGYAVTGSILGDRGRGIAVPIRIQRRVIGCISMRHYKTTLTEADAAKRYLGPLQELATAIGQRALRPTNSERGVKPLPPQARAPKQDMS